jgi:hypothetical protein
MTLHINDTRHCTSTLEVIGREMGKQFGVSETGHWGCPTLDQGKYSKALKFDWDSVDWWSNAGAFQVANHRFICRKARICTFSTVGSARPFAVNISEQWNPSLSAITFSGVPLMQTSSVDTVACRHGSPAVRPLQSEGKVERWKTHKTHEGRLQKTASPLGGSIHHRPCLSRRHSVVKERGSLPGMPVCIVSAKVLYVQPLYSSDKSSA